MAEKKAKSKHETTPQEETLEQSDICNEECEEVQECTSESESLQAEVDRLQNYLLRMKADHENMKKRNANLAKEMYEDGKLETITLLLPVIDSFDRAIAMNTQDEGILAIKKLFDSILEKIGVEEIKSKWEEFDPKYHNALMQVEDEANSGKVVEVYEKGYKYKDKILRHASVVVAK